jgi:hypothetical protein
MCTGGYFRFANDLSQKEHLCTKYSNRAVIYTRGSTTYSPHDSKRPCAPDVFSALQMICHRKIIYVRNIHTAPVICSIINLHHDFKWTCAPEVIPSLQMICHRKIIYVRNIHTAPSYAPLLTYITILSEHVHRRLFPLCKLSATETTFVSFPIYKPPYAPTVISFRNALSQNKQL